MTRRSWTFISTGEDADLRLDQLVSRHTGLSRRQAREALKLGGVQVARKRVRVASRMVPAGTEVRVSVDDSLGTVAEQAIPVVFEDAYLLVVDKPAGLPSQGTQASDRHDLTALLARQFPDVSLRIQHRLDQGTSGLIIFSKCPAGDVGEQFAGRDIRKQYLARLSRPLDACTVDLPIGRLRLARPARFGCPGMPGEGRPCVLEDLLDPRPSVTDFRPAAAEETAGLVPGAYVVAEPRTGRTHQIRVHLASIGAPILGDALYGGAPDPSMWLHAWRLELRHPVTGEPLVLEASPLRFRPREIAE